MLYALIIPIIWQYAGFYILIYYAALKNIPSSLEEAATIDGANAFQIAYKIKLPLAMEVINVTIAATAITILVASIVTFAITRMKWKGSSFVLGFYYTLPKEVEEAAVIDGCSVEAKGLYVFLIMNKKNVFEDTKEKYRKL